jgi:glycosyltransferase involved in cell wall biosynthesis
MNRLLHLTYDSPDNPWCGGGGALRDWRILALLARWERSVCTGRHPGIRKTEPFPRTSLGIGFLGEFVSRRTWAPAAGRHLRQFMSSGGGVASQSASAWAPVWESLNHPRRMLHVVHHIAGEEILKRLGPFGPSSFRFEKRILSEGIHYATPNHTTAARIRSVNPDARIEVIPNGFDPPASAPTPERFGDGPVISFLGRMDHRMKGLDRLLSAFALLSERIPQARLVIAGRSDRAMDAWLSGQLRTHPGRERIHVVPNPDELRKYAILDGSDVFCVPSRFEGWCIAAIEAQSRGLPVVATRTDGTVDSIRDGETGILVENDDKKCPALLADALEALCLDPERRRIWGGAARKWADRFTWESAADATDALLETIRQEAEAIRA